MKNFLLNCSFLAVLFSVSCSSGPGNSENAESVVYKSLTVSDIAIAIDSSSLVYYPKNHSFVLNGNNCLAGYNPTMHTIDIFDLTHKKVLTHIALSKDGPNRILRIYGLFVHTLDSIFVFDGEEGLKLLRANGDTHTYAYDKTVGQIITAAGSGIYFDKKRKSILMYFQANGLGGNEKQKYLAKPIVAEYNLSNNKIDLLPIYYSEYIIENHGDFSSDIIPNLTFYDDQIIYNFIVESGIYSYDRKKESLTSYPGESGTSLNTTVPYSKAGISEDEGIITNTLFQKVHRLENQNLYTKSALG